MDYVFLAADDGSRQQGKKPNTSFFSAARFTLVGMLLLAPLAFGAVEPWAWGSMAIITAIALLLWATGIVREHLLVVAWSWIYAPGVLLFLFLLIQLRGRVSLDPASTREAILKLAVCLVIFFLINQLYWGAATKVWDRLGQVVLLYCSLLGVLAILQYFSAPGMIYWFLESPNTGFGPYVNRDHYAGLMEILIPIAGCYQIAAPKNSPAAILGTFGIVVAITSLLLTGSRGGLVALVAEIVILLVVLLLYNAGKRRFAVVLAAGGVIVAAVAFLLTIAPNGISSRLAAAIHFGDTTVSRDRPKVAVDTLRIFLDHLAVGSGLGTFAAVYPQYQSFPSEEDWDYAHNDYAQFLAETGVVGGILAACALFVFLNGTFGPHLQVRLSVTRGWIQLGAALGCCGLLVHSFVDFNLHVPANAAWFVFSAALASIDGFHIRRQHADGRVASATSVSK
jgi:O-antigen ligase